MIILYSASFEEMNKCYNYESFSILPVQIKGIIEFCREKYNNSIAELIKKMV
jgi:hypothetical protein